MDQFHDDDSVQFDSARLISAYFDDQISESEFFQLTQWLNGSEEHSREFVRAAMMHNGLRIFFQNAKLLALLGAQDSNCNLDVSSEGIRCMLEGDVERRGTEQKTMEHARRDGEGEQAKAGLRINIKKGRWPNRRMLFFAIASSLLLALFGIGVLVDRQANQQQAGVRQGAVFAVCRVADSLKWSDETHQHLKSGDSVRTGRVALESGELKIETFEGAALTLQGPCDVSFEPADRVVCHRGRLLANILRDDAHLVVSTPAGEVLHYGTVYSVNVVDSGATELSVFDGSVGLSPVPKANTPESSHFFFSGHAIRVDASGKAIAQKQQPSPESLGFNSTNGNEPFQPRRLSLALLAST